MGSGLPEADVAKPMLADDDGNLELLSLDRPKLPDRKRWRGAAGGGGLRFYIVQFPAKHL